jgi:mono/diheme cytochrome c family protein
MGTLIDKARTSIAALILSMPAAARADALLDRGTYLMNGIVACGNCHTPKDADGKAIASRELTGGDAVNSPSFHAVPANLTPDPETGIGKWTDAQIIDAIRNGKRPDGSIIGPPMPIAFYRGMSDDDAKAIVAYLRHLKPVKNDVGKSTYKIQLPAAYGTPVTSVPAVDPSDKVAYGRYMAHNLGHCMDCHTPMVQGRNDMSRVGAGGNRFGAPGGGVITSANLTPAATTNTSKWTDAQLKSVIRTGVRPDGSAVVRLMAFDWYKSINDQDMDSLVAYIRSLKAVE